jgi:hypothetical protein
VSAQQFEQLAHRAEDLAKKAEDVSIHLRRLGEGAVDVIGGTATGADQAMLGLAQRASMKAHTAASSFREAARNARNAASAQQENARRQGGAPR